MPGQTLFSESEPHVWLCAKRRWGTTGDELVEYIRAPLVWQMAFTLLHLAARAPGAKRADDAYEVGEVWFEIHSIDERVISDVPVRFSIEDAQRVLVDWLGAGRTAVANLLLDEQRDGVLIDS